MNVYSQKLLNNEHISIGRMPGRSQCQSGPVRVGAMSVERSIWTRVVWSHKQQTEEMGVLGGSNIFSKNGNSM